MANRLEKEDSPYLQHHKDDLVAWYPWCDEAFLKAEEENKAIFISIGYSSCHWCHVMQEKVFNDPTCADILNQHFISIKVDREERPDIDKHYQEVYRLLNRRAGGWPTSIFATPQNKPFYAGTYIAPTSDGTMEGMGFEELTSLIARKIAAYDAEVLKNADEIEQFLGYKDKPKEATVLKESFVKNFMLQVKNNYDPKYGGFSIAPKFPSAATLSALLVVDKLYDDKAAKAMLLNTLQQMSKGGMYDVVDGGFCRYSVDEKWLVPHFEKMLYDNALLSELYAKTALAYGDENFEKIAKDIADFWLFFMSEDNLFYSASDADTNAQEGEYFVYGYDELYEAFTQAGFSDVAQLLEKLSVTKEGNFEGKNIIRIEEKLENFDEVQKVLRTIRSKRDYPFIDKKIQTSWSSMMIRSLFVLSVFDQKYKQQAVKSLEALLEALYKDGVLYHATFIHKEPKVEAFLEDYAFLSAALLEAFDKTQDEIYLIKAQTFANSALEKFYDNGAWNFSVGEFETQEDIADATYTSSVNVMLGVLLKLATLLEDDKYRHFAFKTLEYNSYNLGRKPVFYPTMLVEMLRYLRGNAVVKSSIVNLENQKLARLKYPFVLLRANESEEFMVCGEKSCFANTKNIDEVEEIITQNFSSKE